MKVLFLIYNHTNTSGGGSYHSLFAHVSSMENIVEPLVVNIGRSSSVTIQSLPNFHFLPLVRWNILEFVRLIRIVKKFKPSVINAYDHKSLFIGRILSIIFNIPIIFTKCGGGNGSKVIPFASRYILFSGENYDHYLKYGASKKCLLVPNRVMRPKVDEPHIKEFLSFLNIGVGKIILRISRFNRYYDSTFNQAFALHQKMITEEENLHLVFVGVIQDHNYFLELQRRFNKINVHFVTSSQFTNVASRLIPAADFVVATGRGAMEACAFGKRVYCPTLNGVLPVELTADSFHALSYYNFSERSPISDPSTVSSSISTEDIFDTYFCTDAVIDTYFEMYESLASQSSERIRNFSSLPYHAIQFFRPRFNK